MKRLFVWLGIAIALIGVDRVFAGPAPVESKDFKAAPAPIVEEPLCRWTGFWIGVHGGYGWGEAGLQEHDTEEPAEPRFNHSQEGFVGGGQAGFNLQLGSWFVIGVEGDFAGSAIDESTHFLFTEVDPQADRAPLLVPNVPQGGEDESVRLHTDIDWIGSIGGRAGVTFWKNRFFAFAKGGAAFIGGYDYKLVDDDDPETFRQEHDITTGYFGGGLEYALTCHWSVMFEYKHYFIGDNDDTGHIEETDEEKTFDRDLDLDSVMFGINYKF